MVPERFVVVYPERCLDLLEMLEPKARERQLVGSFSLLVAASAFVIPYERMQSRHPMHLRGHDGDLDSALRRLDSKERFLEASFWNGAEPGGDFHALWSTWTTRVAGATRRDYTRCHVRP